MGRCGVSASIPVKWIGPRRSFRYFAWISEANQFEESATQPDCPTKGFALDNRRLVDCFEETQRECWHLNSLKLQFLKSMRVLNVAKDWNAKGEESANLAEWPSRAIGSNGNRITSSNRPLFPTTNWQLHSRISHFSASWHHSSHVWVVDRFTQHHLSGLFEILSFKPSFGKPILSENSITSVRIPNPWTQNLFNDQSCILLSNELHFQSGPILRCYCK